jgi:cbb3-type cytochrome oxidase subunit 1
MITEQWQFGLLIVAFVLHLLAIGLAYYTVGKKK